ncbi:septal ring lytic transglycosylase RlpA family lipoprotein, partial [Priestia megaterium]
MRVTPTSAPLKLLGFTAMALLIVSCSSTSSRSPVQGGTAVRSMPGLDI